MCKNSLLGEFFAERNFIMALITKSPRGTQDVLQNESHKWRYVETRLAEICERFGYRAVRVPTFEHTELFTRGVGDTTDVVGKEMYTMIDKGGRSITLRPEGTAGVARAYLQNGVLSGPLPVRGYYIMSCFRYEKPQSGRLREFNQLGIELYGSDTPDADCEVIRVASAVVKEFGIKNIRLEINSIGCAECRPAYRKALYDYFSARGGELCETCRERLERNPMRIIDCKSPVCHEIAKDAPRALDYLCGECSVHFEALKALLEAAGIEYTVNPSIVRGLDYYSRTVFEFVHTAAGAQGTMCGGGRYDGLSEILGGPKMPAIGFGMGIERLLSVLESEDIKIPEIDGPELFLSYIGGRGLAKAREITFALQSMGISAQYDINARSLKAQMKYADKLGAKKTIVLGDDEVDTGRAVLRDMKAGTEIPVDLDPARLAAVIIE